MLKVNGEEVVSKVRAEKETVYSSLNLNSTDKVVTVEFKFEGNSSLMDLVFVANYLKNYPKILVLDYIPYLKETEVSRVENLENFCTILNSLGFNKVFTLDPINYSKVKDLIQNLSVDFCYYDWKEVMQEEGLDTICLLTQEDADKYFGSSSPYTKTEDLYFDYMSYNSYTAEKFNGKSVLILDSYFLDSYKYKKVAEDLKQKGAKKVVLYVTHCTSKVHENNLLEGSSPISKVYFSTDVDGVYTKGQSQNLVQIIKEYNV